jgi:hypothetical protein
MNYTLNSRTVIAQMLPGIGLIAALWLMFLFIPPLFTIPSRLEPLLVSGATSTTIGAGLIVLIIFFALLMGVLLDAVLEWSEK